NGIDLEWTGGPDYHEGPVRSQSADGGSHRGPVSHGGNDDFGASEFLEVLCRIVLLGIDVATGSELSRQRLFVLPSRDRYCIESHFDRVLNTKMSKTADAQGLDKLGRA